MDTQAPKASSHSGGTQRALSEPTTAAMANTTAPWPSENSMPQ